MAHLLLLLPQSHQHIRSPLNVLLLVFFFCLFPFPSPSVSSSSVHDLLRSRGLPAGLIPKQIKSYTLSSEAILEVFLDGPCLTQYVENRVLFDSVLRANLSYGGLIGVVGLAQEELFVWLPVKDITVDDPKSGVIVFDIGMAQKQLSLSLFEDPPDCKPRDPYLFRSISSFVA